LFDKILHLDGLLYGAEGRKYALIVSNSNVNPVVKVQSTWDNKDQTDFVRSALIENLIIDGYYLGVTGILLDNVGQCQIRNVTIKNCDVGIHLRSSTGFWSECNYLKHIRMENVKKGIVFTTTGAHPTDANRPGDSAGFTTIDDVGIKLADQSGVVGIQVGGIQMPGDVNTPINIKPYSSRIKANVWLGENYGGTGLKILNGEIKFAQAHLTVMGKSNGTGIGIDISRNKRFGTTSFQDLTYWLVLPRVGLCL